MSIDSKSSRDLSSQERKEGEAINAAEPRDSVPLCPLAAGENESIYYASLI